MAKKDLIVSETEEVGNYLVIQTGIERVKALMKETVGEDGLSPFDLDRAQNPSGKSNRWEIPTIEGDPEVTSELEGVILCHKYSRSYWEGEYSGGDEPPDCSSSDGRVGEVRDGFTGNAGGTCSECAQSKWGSGANNGQSCKLTKHIFLLRSGELLPILIVLTPSSLKEAKKYFRRLLSHQIMPYEVVTRIKLNMTKSKSGFDHATAELSLVSRLDASTAEQMEQYSEFVRPWLDATTSIGSDVVGDSNGPEPF